MITRKIISFGDSFTAGTDLSDCSANSPSQYTWPALMAKDFDLLYGCKAVGGQGNMLISNQVIELYEKSHFKNQNFYVINWTWFERFDYLEMPSYNNTRLSHALPFVNTQIQYWIDNTTEKTIEIIELYY
jgi:hypothetical protein